MKVFCVLACFIIAVQCRQLRVPRDVSELFSRNPVYQQVPVYWSRPDNTQHGYDYPKPGITTRPIYRDAEPGIEVETRPQERPVYPIVPRPVQRPGQGYLPSNNYPNPYAPESFDRTQNTGSSERLFWPLITKLLQPFGQGQTYPSYYGTNSVGYPSTSNQYPSSYPSLTSKFPILSSLFPNYNGYQRIEEAPTVAAVPVQSENIGGFVRVTDFQHPGVSSIGDTVTIDVASSPTPQVPVTIPAYLGDGYEYPNPNELRPPLELPDGLQFKTLPSAEQNST